MPDQINNLVLFDDNLFQYVDSIDFVSQPVTNFPQIPQIFSDQISRNESITCKKNKKTQVTKSNNKIVKSSSKNITKNERQIYRDLRTGKLKVVFPRIPKTDIRHHYPQIMANLYNSYDSNFVKGFLETFCLSNIELIEFLPSKHMFLAGIFPVNVVLGLENFNNILTKDFLCFPDLVFRINSSQIIRSNDSTSSQVSINFTLNVSTVLDCLYTYRPRINSFSPKIASLFTDIYEEDNEKIIFEKLNKGTNNALFRTYISNNFLDLPLMPINSEKSKLVYLGDNVSCEGQLILSCDSENKISKVFYIIT